MVDRLHGQHLVLNHQLHTLRIRKPGAHHMATAGERMGAESSVGVVLTAVGQLLGCLNKPLVFNHRGECRVLARAYAAA